jgi:hypothetical protein
LVVELLSYYTPNNHNLINLNATAAHHVEDRRSSQQNETLFRLANVKENVGIERAVLSTAFGKGTISLENSTHFTTLVANQNAVIYRAKQLADKEFLETLTKLSNSTESKAVLGYRELITGPDKAIAANADRWFVASTKRIDLLRVDEQLLVA